jgi:hypothetical protein
MKRLNKRFYAFLTAFLILFTTIFGNAFFVAKASEPQIVSEENAATEDSTVITEETTKTSDEGEGNGLP